VPGFRGCGMATVRGANRRPAGRRGRAGASPDTWALLAFFTLAYALSWAWVVPLALTHQVVRRGDGWPTHAPALLGPLVAALAVTAWTAGRPGVRELLARIGRWRVAARWWLVAVSPAAFLVVTLAGLRVAGEELPAAADFGRFSGTPAVGVVGAFLIITLVGSLGEESGWRGFALPRLQRRLGALNATLVLAPLWWLWHLPQFFVIATYREFEPYEYAGMLLGLTSGALVLTWLYNRSGGSVLLCVVWHGAYNLVAATQASVGTIAAVVSTLVIVQALVLLAFERRARRRGRPSVLGPAPAT
jgi:membrane protease YdiL (CAAX protease family)